MKKVLALTLTIAVMFSMTAMAEGTIEVNGETSKDVIATYNEGADGGTIYSVDILWGSMAFTYNAESNGVWSPDTHEYENVAAASWTHAEGANVISVTNHSNAEVCVNIAFNSSVDGVSGTFDKTELKLATAVGTDKNDAPNESAFLALSGELPQSTEAVTVGSVTITIGDLVLSEGEYIPAIIEMSTDSSLSSVSSGFTIDIAGTNLDQLTDENFDSYITIFAVMSGDESVILPVSSNKYATYLANSNELATITYEPSYFSTMMGGQVSLSGDVTSMSYMVNSIGEKNNILIIN